MVWIVEVRVTEESDEVCPTRNCLGTPLPILSFLYPFLYTLTYPFIYCLVDWRRDPQSLRELALTENQADQAALKWHSRHRAYP